MNAGFDNKIDILLQNLEKYQRYFEKIFVCDGNLTSKAKEYYSKLDNVEVEDFPWDDDYQARYKKNAEKAPEGSWVLHLDSDEIPSRELINFISGISLNCNLQKYSEDDTNTFCLPCVLHLTDDGENFYPAESSPEISYKGQWFKNILFKVDDSLEFKAIGSHVIPNHGSKEKGKYIPFPYFHMKSLQSFVYNDVFQAFLNPLGQQFNQIDAKLFKTFTKNYKTTQDFKRATKEGAWSPPLKKFAWDRRNKTDNPVSRLAWVYFILEGHKMPGDDSWMKWGNVKKFILEEKKINLFEKNKKEGKKLIL